MLELPRTQPELVHKHSVHLASPGRGTLYILTFSKLHLLKQGVFTLVRGGSTVPNLL